jgi:hypothetical protein
MEPTKKELIEEILEIGREWGKRTDSLVRGFLKSNPTRSQMIGFVKQRCWNELQGAHLFAAIAAKFCTRLDDDLLDFLTKQSQAESRHFGLVYGALTSLGADLKGFTPHPALVSRFEGMHRSMDALDPAHLFAAIHCVGEVEAYTSIVPLAEELRGTEYHAVAEAHAAIIKEEDEHMNMGVVGVERYGTVESLQSAKEFILKRGNTAWGDLFRDL